MVFFYIGVHSSHYIQIMSTVQSERSPWRILMAASASCLVNTVVTNPIEVAKLQMQYAPLTCPHYPHARLSSFYKCNCVKFNWKNCFKGFTVNLSQSLTSTMSYMMFYEHFRGRFIEKLSSAKATLSAALLSRLLVSSIFIPIEAFRVRFINSTQHNPIKQSSYGFKVTLARDTIYSCLFWFSVEKVRNVVAGGEYRSFQTSESKLLYNNIIPAFISGSVISALTTPLDTIKTRIQSGVDLKGSIRSQLAEMHKREGWAGFFSGVHYRVARNTLGACIYIPTYEYMLQRLSSLQ